LATARRRLDTVGAAQFNDAMTVAYAQVTGDPTGAPASTGMAGTAHPHWAGSGDPLLGMLMPLWQILIGCCVVVVVVVASARLARRGRSRMGTALLVTGAAIIGLSVLGVLGIVR
jgi:hypothetical protein